MFATSMQSSAALSRADSAGKTLTKTRSSTSGRGQLRVPTSKRYSTGAQATEAAFLRTRSYKRKASKRGTSEQLHARLSSGHSLKSVKSDKSVVSKTKATTKVKPTKDTIGSETQTAASSSLSATISAAALALAPTTSTGAVASSSRRRSFTSTAQMVRLSSPPPDSVARDSEWEALLTPTADGYLPQSASPNRVLWTNGAAEMVQVPVIPQRTVPPMTHGPMAAFPMGFYMDPSARRKYQSQMATGQLHGFADLLGAPPNMVQPQWATLGMAALKRDPSLVAEQWAEESTPPAQRRLATLNWGRFGRSQQVRFVNLPRRENGWFQYWRRQLELWWVDIFISAELYSMFSSWRTKYLRNWKSFERWNGRFVEQRRRQLTGFAPLWWKYDAVNAMPLQSFWRTVFSYEMVPMQSVAHYNLLLTRDLATPYIVPFVLGLLEMALVVLGTMALVLRWPGCERLARGCGALLALATCLHLSCVWKVYLLVSALRKRVKCFKAAVRKYSKQWHGSGLPVNASDNAELWAPVQKWLGFAIVEASVELQWSLLALALLKYVLLLNCAALFWFPQSLWPWLALWLSLGCAAAARAWLSHAGGRLLRALLWPGAAVALVLGYCLYLCAVYPVFAAAALLGLAPFLAVATHLLLSGYRIVQAFEWLSLLLLYAALLCYYVSFLPKHFSALLLATSLLSAFVALQKEIHRSLLRHKLDSAQYIQTFFRKAWFREWLARAFAPADVQHVDGIPVDSL